jgi:hypothetical protein
MTTRFFTAAAVLAAAVATPPAGASTLATAPFPGNQTLAAIVRCMATNVGKKPADVTVVAYDFTGTPLTSELHTVAAGATIIVGSIGLMSGFQPAGCRFDVGSKGSWRGSLVYTPDVGDPQVIPAQ